MSEGREPAETRLHVVQVLNARELVISGGSEAGLSEDDIVRVLAPVVALKDPVTGEDLGELVTAKAVLRVYQVAPKYALARTFRSRRVKTGGGGLLGGYTTANVFSPPKYETRTETLLRDTRFDISGEMAVEAGDPVELWDGSVDDVPSVTTWA